MVNNIFSIKEISPNIWLMINHRWAYFAWEHYRIKNKLNNKICLVHIDSHWDAVDDISNDSTGFESIQGSLNKIYDYIKQNKHIKNDSFIVPALEAGIFNQIFFYCKHNVSQVGIWDEILKRNYSTQKDFQNIDELVKNTYNKNIALDIDLDIFVYNSFRNEIWEEREIRNFFSSIESLIKNSLIITVAISPKYIGNKNNAKYLTKIALEKILLIRAILLLMTVLIFNSNIGQLISA